MLAIRRLPHVVGCLIALAAPATHAEPPAEEATLRLTLVDGETGRPLPKPRAELFGPGERSYKTAIRPRRDRDDGAPLAFTAPPGEYTIVATQRPRRLDGLMYTTLGDAPTVTLRAGKTTTKTIDLHPRPLTPEEISQRAPFTAFGTVTDDTGQPLRGVEVRVATGWGTLLGGGRTRTNDQGEYILRFGTGVLMLESESQFQVAQFRVDAPGYVESSRSKPYRYLDVITPEELLDDATREQVFVKGESGRLDFVMTRAATLRVRVVGVGGSESDDLRLKLVSDEERENASQRLQDADGKYLTAWEVAPNHPWRLAVGKRSKTRSVPFTLPKADAYEAIFRYREASLGSPALLELIEIRDSAGRAVEFNPEADPFAQPPLPPAEQRRAEELVARIAEANAPWLDGVPEDFPPYRYRYTYHDAEPKETEVRITPGAPGWRNHGRHQGVTLHTALHALARNPDAAIYRSLEESDNEITIAFTFRSPGKWAIGAGVKGSWRGYFSRPMQSGTLVVDAERLTPRELRGDDVVITFDDYREVDPGQYVPLRMRVDMERQAWFDWRFAWREPGVWLYQEGTRPGRKHLATSVDGLKIEK